MADKELVIKEKVEHTGLFDFPSFYSFAHAWLKDLGYGVDEEKYVERTDGDKRDITVEWKATKRFTDYFKFEHKIKFEIKGLTDVEAEIDGKKKVMNKGRVTVELKGTLIMDPDSKWDTSPFTRFTRDIYNKYIVPSRVNEGKTTVSDDMQNFKEELKAFLDLTGRR